MEVQNNVTVQDQDGNSSKPLLVAGLSDLQRAEATIEFMNLFRQMLNDARFF